MDKKAKIELKLSQVFNQLGISFNEGINIVNVNPGISTACWGIKNNKEFIHINPDIVFDYSVEEIEMILRHEFLHRCFYNGFYENFSNPELSNIVLDIVINKILYLNYKESMLDLCSKIYPKESFSTIIALANSSLSPQKTSPELAEMYSEIWTGKQVPNPSSLYYRLLKISMVSGIKYRFYADPKNDISAGTSTTIIEQADKIFSKIQHSRVIDILISKYGSNELKKKRDYISEFINKQKIYAQLTDAVEMIKEHMGNNVRFMPYALYPSRLGLVYIISGISDITHIYINRQNEFAKPNVAVYIDSSGSMQDYLNSVLWIIAKLDDLDMDIYYFDTDIHYCSREDFFKGRVLGGGGTDFSSPVMHFSSLESNTTSAVFFTDGEADISEPAKNEFLQSGKNIYSVFFNYKNDHKKNPLGLISKDIINVHI